MVKKGGQTTSFLFEFNTFIGQYWLQTYDNYPKDLRFVIGGKTMGNGGSEHKYKFESLNT